MLLGLLHACRIKGCWLAEVAEPIRQRAGEGGLQVQYEKAASMRRASNIALRYRVQSLLVGAVYYGC